MDTAESVAPLAAIEGVRLVSVQKVGGLEQLVLAPFPVENLGPELDEGDAALMDTAALIQNVDLVITNDSAVAHLAGALGVPTWVGAAGRPRLAVAAGPRGQSLVPIAAAVSPVAAGRLGGGIHPDCR